MAVFAPSDLKKWRVAQGISAADLGEIVSCDTSTIHRYEAGKIKMNPDVMYQICEALGDISIWCSWMRTEYPISYARVHPECVHYDLPGALMTLFADLDDVQKMQKEVLRDGADGKIDDPKLAETLDRELTELMRSVQRVTTLYLSAKHEKGD
jgi:transcriptional regulator with XRE-family HTH domain